MNFSIKDFFSKYDQIQSLLATFTKEILNGNLHFCVKWKNSWVKLCGGALFYLEFRPTTFKYSKKQLTQECFPGSFGKLSAIVGQTCESYFSQPKNSFQSYFQIYFLYICIKFLNSIN